MYAGFRVQVGGGTLKPSVYQYWSRPSVVHPDIHKPVILMQSQQFCIFHAIGEGSNGTTNHVKRTLLPRFALCCKADDTNRQPKPYCRAHRYMTNHDTLVEEEVIAQEEAISQEEVIIQNKAIAQDEAKP